MKLNNKFDALWKAVRRITEKTTDFNLTIESTWEDTEYERIAAELKAGKNIELKDIETIDGLLTYKGQHVLLYIPDHGRYIEGVINGTSTGNKFHVADCDKLDEMRSRKRFERYIATTNTSGEFKIAGFLNNDPSRQVEITKRLCVCKLCLNKLDYQGYKYAGARKTSIYESFDLNEFFETYSTKFKNLPSRSNVAKDMAVYPKDWASISENVRAKATWCCQGCGVNLSEHKNLLHTHHINGNKNDTRPSNLIALCSLCHKEQPSHERIYIDPKDQKKIESLRAKQGLTFSKREWELKLAKAPQTLRVCLQHFMVPGWPAPELKYSLAERTFDAAWPSKKVAIDLNTRISYKFKDWTVLSYTNAIAYKLE